MNNYITNLIARMKAKRLYREHVEDVRKAYRNLQFAEFDGIIYLTHNGEPVVPISALNTDPVIQLRASRKQLGKYYEIQRNQTDGHELF